MKTMRLFLRDRLLAGTGTALIVYLLVFQALLAGMAHGSMAAMAADPLGIVCASDGSVSAGHTTPEDGSGTDPLHCPCATLCQVASGLATIAPAAAPVLAYIAPLGTTIAHADRTPLLAPSVSDFAARPRAPPHLSV